MRDRRIYPVNHSDWMTNVSRKEEPKVSQNLGNPRCFWTFWRLPRVARGHFCSLKAKKLFFCPLLSFFRDDIKVGLSKRIRKRKSLWRRDSFLFVSSSQFAATTFGLLFCANEFWSVEKMKKRYLSSEKISHQNMKSWSESKRVFLFS